MWKIEFVEGWDAVNEAGFWADYVRHFDAAEARHVFFRPEMVATWLETYRPLRKLTPMFVTARNERGNVAMLPMVMWRRNWKNAFIRSIVPVGYSDYDYHDPVFKMTPLESEICEFWEDMADALKLRGADEIVVDGIRDRYLPKKMEGWTRGEICPNLAISQMSSEEDLMGFFKTKLRGDIRRQIRRLEEIGTLEFRVYGSASEVDDRIFEEFMAAHSRRWPNAYKAPGYHRNLLAKCGEDGPVSFSTLSVGDDVVAWHLGFEEDGRYYYYMPAGNAEYQKYSPVKVHLYFLIKRAIEKGMRTYDHLRGDEAYKSGWADGSEYVNTWKWESPGNGARVKRRLMALRGLIWT